MAMPKLLRPFGKFHALDAEWPSPHASAARMATNNIDLLKAALLDGDAAVRAYRVWRSAFDPETVSYGQQRLLPLVHRNMTRLGVNDPLFERLRGLRRYYAARNLHAISLVRSLFAELDRTAISFIVLKGAALVAAYLDDCSLHPMDDIDILVRDEHVPAAVEILTAMEMTPTGADVRPLFNRRVRSTLPGWAFNGANQNIDLHWRALHLDRRPLADDQFWQCSREASLDGMTVRILDPAHQLLHIFAHAAQDFNGAAVHQWPADAALVIRATPDLSWERLIREAGARRISAIAANGLAFLAREIDLPIPDAVIAELRTAVRWTERVETRLRAAGPRTSLSTSSRLLLDFQDFRRGDPDALEQCAARAFLPFLKARAGVMGGWSASLAVLQALLGHPAWLRHVLGRDRYRAVPDLARLPVVGEILDLRGVPLDEAPLVAGWGLPESTGHWTVDHEATAAWRVIREAVHLDVDLLLDGYALLPGEDGNQDIEVWLNDRLIETLRFRAGRTWPLPAWIRLPRWSTDCDLVIVTLLVRKIYSPAALGLSGDHRALGIHLRRFGPTHFGSRFAVDRERLPSVGDTLNLTGSSTDETPFVIGWGGPETTGRWTIGTRATVAWRVEESDSDLTLLCDGHAFLDSKMPEQEIEVWANDELVASWHFSDGEASPLPARVALPNAQEAGILFVTFKVSSPRSPVELGLARDARALGLHVRSLTIVSGDPYAQTVSNQPTDLVRN